MRNASESSRVPPTENHPAPARILLNPSERWLPIPDWPAHEVSDLGRVRRIADWRTGERIEQLLATPPRSKTHAYPAAHLRHDGRRWLVGVHILVMLAFVGPRPSGMEVGHGDDDKSNPRLDNLEYVTGAKNTADAYKRGRARGPMVGAKAKLSPEQVAEIRDFGPDAPRNELARKFNVHPKTITEALKGRTWRNLGVAA